MQYTTHLHNNAHHSGVWRAHARSQNHRASLRDRARARDVLKADCLYLNRAVPHTAAATMATNLNTTFTNVCQILLQSVTPWHAGPNTSAITVGIC